MNLPVTLHPRRAMTKARRTRLWEARGGVCLRCKLFWPLEDCEIDHRVALALGGSNEDDNMELLCWVCHSRKTKLDVKAIAKAKRREAKHNGTARKPNRTIASRPFGKSSRKIVGRGFERRAK